MPEYQLARQDSDEWKIELVNSFSGDWLTEHGAHPKSPYPRQEGTFNIPQLRAPQINELSFWISVGSSHLGISRNRVQIENTISSGEVH